MVASQLTYVTPKLKTTKLENNPGQQTDYSAAARSIEATVADCGLESATVRRAHLHVEFCSALFHHGVIIIRQWKIP